MYKFFLCLRYLRSKVLAYFAIIGVAVCVWMMVTAVSVMTGFLQQIEAAAKGLFGDIVMEAGGERGIAWYDEFMTGLTDGPFGIAGSLTAEQLPNRGLGLPAYAFRGTLPTEAVETLADRGLFQDKPVTILPASGAMRIGGQDAQSVTGLLEVRRSGRASFRPDPSQQQMDVYRTLGRLAGEGALATASLDGLRADLSGPVADVEAAGPFVLSFGMIRVESAPDYRQHVQLAGIRLPHRARVTDFEEGLFVQPNDPAPTWDPPLEKVKRTIDAHREEVAAIARRELPAEPDAPLTVDQQILARKIRNALSLQQDAHLHLDRAMKARPDLARLRAELEEA
ncbi:MAG: hypothetical protein KGY81_09400, partial [Phycisphaerae bacterium]|nr:hypothetical protein [Phycisphaerae bacterium]